MKFAITEDWDYDPGEVTAEYCIEPYLTQDWSDLEKLCTMHNCRIKFNIETDILNIEGNYKDVFGILYTLVHSNRAEWRDIKITSKVSGQAINSPEISAATKVPKKKVKFSLNNFNPD